MSRRQPLSEVEKEGLRIWQKQLDLSQVKPRHRPEVLAMCTGMVTLFRPIPDLVVSVVVASRDSPDMTAEFKNFCGEVDVEFLMRRLILPATRDACFVGVKNAILNPHTKTLTLCFRCGVRAGKRGADALVSRGSRRRVVTLENGLSAAARGQSRRVGDGGGNEEYLKTVDSDHRSMVRAVIEGIQGFDSLMPPLDSIEVVDAGHRYKVIAQFKHGLRLTKTYRMFLNKNRRIPEFANILSACMEPRLKAFCIRIAKPHTVSQINTRQSVGNSKHRRRSRRRQ